MTDLKNQVPDNIKFKDTDRNKLYLMFSKGFYDAVSVESLTKPEDKENVTGKDGKDEETDGKTARYAEEKRLFLSFLMDSSSSSLVDTLKTIKYDYMNGFLLFLSSNNCFHYGFGYFKDKQEAYLEFLENWNSFMNNLVTDITNLPEIKYTKPIVIEINGFLLLTVQKDSIVSIGLNPMWFDRIFSTNGYQYEFRLMVSQEQDEKSIIETGNGDGKGKDSGLYKSVDRFNALVETITRKDEQYINDSHGQE